MQQQSLPFLYTLSDTEPPESLWERFYRYFVEAEETQSIVTSVKIQQIWLAATGELRDLNAVRWYMYRYWRWFLFLEDDRVKPYRYSCRNIKSYPLDYFVQAHMDTSRMQYLVHFVRSIETDKELRKLAVGRGPKRPRPFPTQQSPETDDQQQIQVDDHLAEEEEENIPDIEMSSEEQRAASFPLSDDIKKEESSYSGKSSLDRQDMPRGNDKVEVPLLDTPLVIKPDPDSTPPRSDPPFWSRVKDVVTDHKVGVAIGAGLVLCVVVVYFFFVKHPR